MDLSAYVSFKGDCAEAFECYEDLLGATPGLLFRYADSPMADVVPAGKAAPEFAGGAWVNSEPLSMQKLRGRVVLIDFWPYG